MKIIINDIVTQVRDYLSKADLPQATSLRTELFFGDTASKYTLLELEFPTESRRAELLCGIEEHGTQPVALIVESQAICIIAAASTVIAIDLTSMAVLWQRSLWGVFFEMFPVPSARMCVIVSEIGAIGITYNGAERWRRDCNIVETIDWDGAILRLRDSEGAYLAIDVVRGTDCA